MATATHSMATHSMATDGMATAYPQHTRMMQQWLQQPRWRERQEPAWVAMPVAASAVTGAAAVAAAAATAAAAAAAAATHGRMADLTASLLTAHLAFMVYMRRAASETDGD